jgi:hypothetical protein
LGLQAEFLPLLPHHRHLGLDLAGHHLAIGNASAMGLLVTLAGNVLMMRAKAKTP